MESIGEAYSRSYNAMLSGQNREDSQIMRLLEQSQRFGLEKQRMALEQQRMQQTGLLNNERLQLMKAQIARIRQQTENLKNGGGLGSTGLGSAPIQAQNNMLANISNDNPQLKGDPVKIQAAANAILNGQSTLADGTKINPPSPLTLGAIGDWAKYQTTAQALNRGILANQGEAEADLMNKKIQDYVGPYGTTYFNMSPQQLIDSFKSDDASQDRLGKLIAAQMLSYDLAQMVIKINGGQSAEGITRDLMNNSGTKISTAYPRLSNKARQAALQYELQAYQQVLAARNAVGVNAAQVTNPSMVGSGFLTNVINTPSSAPTNTEITTNSGKTVSSSVIQQYANQHGMTYSQAEQYIKDNA